MIIKKILLLFGTLLFAFNLSAQNYDGDYYLRQAYSALEEGKIEVAQSSYNVYKNATGKTDVDFETLLKDKSENDWKKSCFIIDLGDGYCLAVQKVLNSPLCFENARQVCEANRLGGFTDWRLPTLEECITFFSLGYVGGSAGDFWTKDKRDLFTEYGLEVRYKTIDNQLRIGEAPVCRLYDDTARVVYMDITYRYLIVRKFKR